MADNKKEQEREELHRAIWAIADELRGAVDGWDFKNYVLGTMFYRYVSENLSSYVNSGEEAAGNAGFDYAQLPDDEAEEAREGLVEEKGFFILPSELFANVRAKAADNENLNETLETVFRHIEESAKGSTSESDFAGLFDDFDVNSNKLGATVARRNEKLVKLLNGVAEMNLGDVKHHDIDAFGKEVLITIRKAIDASPELRSKKALIETFIANVSDVDDVMTEWRSYVAEEKEKELVQIIRDEKLREPETRKYLDNAFRDGEIKTVGTEIDQLMPPVSRFGGGGRAKKKQGVIDRLKAFFERFFGVG